MRAYVTMPIPTARACEGLHIDKATRQWPTEFDPADVAITIRAAAGEDLRVTAIRCKRCGMRSGRPPKDLEQRLIASSAERDDVGPRYGAKTACSYRGCTSAGVELHHFGPRNTFDDADNWPVMPLCAHHHRVWHQTMNGYQWSRKSGQ